MINSKEQMFTEKLRSLLKFGPNSTRFKDIFDMCYLSDLMNRDKLMTCLDIFVFSDPGMRENNMHDICRRVNNTFDSSQYVFRLSSSRKNWLNIEISDALKKLSSFLETL